jgi:hypothetical protein
MKEYVHVEFLFPSGEFHDEFKKLDSLGEDFHCLHTFNEHETDEDGNINHYIRVSGKIYSQTASLIKLQNPALAGKMRISYIPDELKDKYRR